MARKINEKFTAVTDQMAAAGPDGMTNEEKMAFIRNDIKKFVEELLSDPNKNPVDMTEARLRMQGYLKYELDQSAANTDIIEASKVFPSMLGPVEKSIPMPEIFKQEITRTAIEMATYEHAEEWFDSTLFELVKREIFDREEIDNDNAMPLVRLFLRAKIAYCQALAEKYNGGVDIEQRIFAAPSIDYPRGKKKRPRQNAASDRPRKPSILLSQLIEKYCATQMSDKKWKPNMLIEHKGRVCNIVDILGDKPAAEVSREDMRHVKDTLPLLPVARKKKPEYRDKSIQAILKMKPKETLSIPTVNKIILSISAMYEWAIREGILKENPAKGLKTIDPEAAIDKRSILSDAEIRKVFFRGDYTLSAIKNPAYYWCPLIGLYSGMRLEEICQLHCEDVYQKDGIWIFDIKTSSTDGLNDKILKTKNAIRQVPIHDKLIELGLLDYLRLQQANKEIRLFPLLRKSVNSKYGKQVGKYFTRLLNSKGIEGKSFHSLRHSFANFFKVRGLQDDVFRQVFGHEIGELASHTYGERFSPKLCYDRIISKLDYSTNAISA